MAVYILDPVLTDEIILTIFKHLCACEIRKLTGVFPALQEGLQDGYIVCLTDLFGESSEEISESMYQREKSYIFVIDRIIATVNDEIEELKRSLITEEFKGLDRIQDIAEKATNNYFALNSNEMIEAIKFL